MKLRPMTLLLGLLLLAAACGQRAETTAGSVETTDADTDGPGSSEPADGDGGLITSPDRSMLESGTWILTDGGDAKGPLPLVDDWPITLTFDGETLGGRAACNGYGGRYRIVDDELTIDALDKEEQGCAPAVMEAESRYLEALPMVDRILFETNGNEGASLTLSGSDLVMVFNRSDPVDSEALLGRIWLLEQLISENEPRPAEGEPATLRVEADGSFTASTGCRTLSGRYIVSGSGLYFNEMAADGNCPASLRDQDGFVVAVLGDGFTPTVDGDRLTLRSVGDQALDYRLSSEDEVASLPGTDVVSDAEALNGIEWIFVGGDSPDGPIPDPRTIDPAATITFVFVDGAYEGVAVCNAYGGSADIGNSLWSFTLGPAEGEQEGCGDDLDGPDGPIARYLDALPNMSEGGVESDGERLVMNGNAIELHFERAG